MSATSSCPSCNGELLDGSPFPIWCPSCEWGVHGEGTTPPVEAKARARLTALEQECEKLQSASVKPSFSAQKAGVYVMALSVNLLTVACFVGAGLLAVSSLALALRIVLGALLVMIGVAVRPRVGRLASAATELSRADAPALYALTDEVADQLGAERVSVIALDRSTNANIRRVGWRQRSALTIGVPLWMALNASERVALLGHELAHTVNGDTSMSLLVGSADRALATWVYLLKPDSRDVQVSTRPAGVGRPDFLAALIQTSIVAAIELYRRGLQRHDLKDAIRAEYYADALSARVAGRSAAVSVLDVMSMREGIDWALRQAAQDESGDPWRVLRDEVNAVPPIERARRRRLGARQDHRIDATHPPTYLRQAFVESRPADPPLVTIDTARAAMLDREVAEYGRALLASKRRQISKIPAQYRTTPASDT